MRTCEHAKIAVAALLLSAIASNASAQTVTGTVVDTTLNTRVAAAEVILLQVDSSYRATTDSTGRFRFYIKPGVFKLHIRALGYAELQSQVYSVDKRENLSVLVQLTTDPVAIAPLYVLGRSRRPLSDLQQFEQRRKRGWGYFVDAKAIEKWPAFDITDILKRVPGATVTRTHVSLRPDCVDALYLVDGMPIRPGAGMTATEMVSMMLSPEEIGGVEVYKSDANIPAELTVMSEGAPLLEGGSCGVIAVWSKR
jgi:hypothetical protein